MALFLRRRAQPSTDSLDAATISHILRRCGFGPKPGEVDAWEGRPTAELLSALLDNETITVADASDFPFGDDGGEDEAMFLAVVGQFYNGSNPLHERMTWYWHTHFTSSIESVGLRHAWTQHQLFRRHALGNFGEFARAVTTDPAMLFYLDGNGSRGENPNENFAREFLELFALGRDGGYTEADVRAAARIFSGWWVDWETGEVTFDAEAHYGRPVTFMGKRQRWSVDSFVEYVTGLRACHRHVVTRLYHFFVGPNLSDDRRDELADVFADSGLELKPLMRAMLTGEDFLAARHARTRQPLEWALGAMNALGFENAEEAEMHHWQLGDLGQVPLLPPNVAGWPLDDRWASPSQIVARTSLLLDWEVPERTVDAVAPTADAVLRRCGIFEPSESTRKALERIESEFSEFDYRLELLFVSVLSSPEFTLL